MPTEAEESLKASFKEVGKRYGYDTVDADFAAFKDFKVSWERSYRTASFHVSDYVIDAPREVIECIADSIFSKIMGMKNKPYTDEMKEWTLSQDFIKAKQPIYIRRNRNISASSKGLCKDLKDSVSRLADMGLIRPKEQLELRWAREGAGNSAGYCSPVMNVIVISPLFDMDDVPDYVVDFVVYHEFLMLEEGRRCFGSDFDGEFREHEKKYPRYEEVQRWLTRACIEC